MVIRLILTAIILSINVSLATENQKFEIMTIDTMCTIINKKHTVKDINDFYDKRIEEEKKLESKRSDNKKVKIIRFKDQSKILGISTSRIFGNKLVKLKENDKIKMCPLQQVEKLAPGQFSLDRTITYENFQSSSGKTTTTRAYETETFNIRGMAIEWIKNPPPFIKNNPKTEPVLGTIVIYEDKQECYFYKNCKRNLSEVTLNLGFLEAKLVHRTFDGFVFKASDGRYFELMLGSTNCKESKRFPDADKSVCN